MLQDSSVCVRYHDLQYKGLQFHIHDHKMPYLVVRVNLSTVFPEGSAVISEHWPQLSLSSGIRPRNVPRGRYLCSLCSIARLVMVPCLLLTPICGSSKGSSFCGDLVWRTECCIMKVLYIPQR